MGDLYEADILEWSEQQGALLRRIAAGERIDDADLDWPNIAVEIESVGRSQLSSVRSFLIQALLHDLKAEAWPMSRDASTWRSDALRFRGDAADNFSPSMRQKLDMAQLYRRALKLLPEKMDCQPPLPVPQECPLTLDELLSEP